MGTYQVTEPGSRCAGLLRGRLLAAECRVLVATQANIAFTSASVASVVVGIEKPELALIVAAVLLRLGCGFRARVIVCFRAGVGVPVAMSDGGGETDKNIEIWKIKKLIKALESARGNGTSMISLIMPPRFVRVFLKCYFSRRFW